MSNAIPSNENKTKNNVPARIIKTAMNLLAALLSLSDTNGMGMSMATAAKIAVILICKTAFSSPEKFPQYKHAVVTNSAAAGDGIPLKLSVCLLSVLKTASLIAVAKA